MKEYIVNLVFENWMNQLWFMNTETIENNEKWETALKEIETRKKNFTGAMEFQNHVIEYLEQLGFVRIEK